MNILYGIALIIIGALVIFFIIRRLLALKRNYFGNIIVMLLYAYLAVGGAIIVIYNKDGFPLSGFLYMVLAVIVIVQWSQWLVLRSRRSAKSKR